MDLIKDLFLKIKQKVSNFLMYFHNRLKFSFFAILVVFLASFSIFLWHKKVHYVVLYRHLSDSDSKWIISKLKNMNISYQFRDSSKTLLVPESNFPDLRFALMNNNNYDLEQRSGFRLLDKEKFGISQFHEKVNYNRGLEEELSKTLERIFPIQNARIHLVCKTDTEFFRETQIPSASVVLTLFPNTELKQEQIDAITLLVSSSVPDLSPDRVILVNQLGDILNKYDLNNTEFFNKNQYKKINVLEGYYCDSIKKILIPLYGSKNLVIKVKAKISFKNISSGHPCAHSHSISHSCNSDYLSRFSLNNILYFHRYNNYNIKFFNILKSNFVNFFYINFFENNYFGRNFIDNFICLNFFNKQKNSYTQPNLLNCNNFVTNKKDTKISNRSINLSDKSIYFPGFKKNEIKNLTVTVLINYKKNNLGIFVPLSARELEDIEILTKSAINFSKNRGDRINIINFMFSRSANSLNFKNSSLFVNLDRFMFFYFICFLFLFLFFIFSLKKIFFTISLDNTKKYKSCECKKKNDLLNVNKYDKLNKNNCLIKKTMFNKSPKIIERVIRYWIRKK